MPHASVSGSVRQTPPPRRVDLLIRHGHLLTMDDAGTVIEDGSVAVTDGRIVAVGPDRVVIATHDAARVIDAGSAPVHPGLVESHLHASYHLHRGAVPDELSKDDVFEAIERAFYDTVTDEEEHLAVALAAIEMLRNGTTTFLEAGTVLEPAAAAAAAERVGIRAVLGDVRVVDPAVATRPPIRRAPRSTEEAIARLGRQVRAYPDPTALVSGHVTVHGLGTASDRLLVEARAAADAAGATLNLHQSYAMEDTEADRRRSGMDPVLRLAELGVLGPNVTLGHANHLSDAERDAIAASRTTTVWAPAASMLWGNGSTLVSRHADLWHRGANVALGSDSGNWSNSFDLFRQANLALLIAREVRHDRRALLAEDVLRMATRGGAWAAGRDVLVGSLEPGKLADIVIHTLARPELNPTTDAVRNLVYAAGAKSVSTVIVNGQVVLDRGVFPGFDEKALLAEIRAASRALLGRMGYTVGPNRPGSSRPGAMPPAS